MSMTLAIDGFGEPDAEWQENMKIRMAFQERDELDELPQDLKDYFEKNGLEKDIHLNEEEDEFRGPKIDIEEFGGNNPTYIDVSKIPPNVKYIRFWVI